MTIEIKPLEWEDFEGNGAKANAFYQASYLITRWRGRDEFEVALSFPGYQTGYDGERFHKTLEAAKSAAQADYEARIRSALTPAPVTAQEAAATPEAHENTQDGASFYSWRRICDRIARTRGPRG